MPDVCLWPLDAGCLDATWTAFSQPIKDRAILLASATLQRLTAGRVGDCPVTVRPNLQGGSCGFYAPSYGGWLPATNGLPDPRELRLPLPAYAVGEVRIGGAVVPTTDYKLFDNGILRYTGLAYTGWPVTQNWDAANNQPGYFAVTYLNTAPVDDEGKLAAGLLAVEFAKACGAAPGAKCRLPLGVTTIVRSGVSVEIASGAFPGGLTGIREVDNYVAKWNRNGRAPATILDPAAPDFRVETGVTGWEGPGDGILDGGTP